MIFFQDFMTFVVWLKCTFHVGSKSCAASIQAGGHFVPNKVSGLGQSMGVRN